MTPSTAPVKLVCLNAWTGRTKDLLVRYLKEESADIACLQEVMSITGNPGLFRSFEQIAKRVGYEDTFFSPAWSFKYMHRTAALGNGIASRLPLSDKTTKYTHLSYIRNFDYDHDNYDVRCLQHSIVTIEGIPCHIINYQGHHVRSQTKQGDDHSLAHSQLIADYVEGLFGPVIVAGDFNLAPTSPALAPLHKQLRNLSVEYDLPTTRTALTSKTEVCDYVFVNKYITVHDFQAVDTIVSDHQPLVLTFSC